jgi:hypothetical protein
LSDELDKVVPDIHIPGVTFGFRKQLIHHRPIVAMSPKKSCELGDMLIVVKYHLLDYTTEAKSIIYQVKLADRGTSCKIDPVQLDLLAHWPDFAFGRRADGGPRTYSVHPVTPEFGSFMLEPRGEEGDDLWEVVMGCPLGMSRGLLWARRKPYGLCPTAWQILDDGPARVDISSLPHVQGDVDSVLSQIAFLSGEHHSNASVKQFIDALYRYVGLDLDPPEEFQKHPEDSDERGFAIFEISVRQTGEEGG